MQLRAVPTDLTTHVREALDAVLESYHEGAWDVESERRERWAKAWAQRSVASGDVSMPMEVRRKLIAALWACDHPNVDPDGRQVLSVWAAEDLENPFR